MSEIISSRQNPLIKHFAELYRSAGARREAGELVCDGNKLLTDALESGYEPLAVLRTGNAALPPLPPGTREVIIPERLMEQLSGQKTPQGVMFSVKNRQRPVIGDKFILLDRVQDPGNVGAILRSAEAFGFSVILTPGCADPTSPKVVRAAMGAALRVGIHFSDEPHIGPCFAACAGGEDIRLAGIKTGVLMLGSEGSGLSKELIGMADRRVGIPMAGRTESLNVAAAAAILMWEMSR